MTIEVRSFGCRLNGAEAETMRVLALDARLERLTVINTCAVTQDAARQAGQAVRRAVRERPDDRIVVTGCAAQTDPGRFAAPGSRVTVIDNARKLDPAIWRALRLDGGLESAPMRPVHPADAPAAPVAPVASDASAGRVRAFVAVQTGCDHDCTFCIIPAGRGRSRSMPVARVIDAVRVAVEGGVREVVLTGVDITAYGQDGPGARRLGGLVKAILAAVPDLPRLRLSSIDSVEADRDLLDALATEARLMPHLHLSLQAGDDLILKRMKRRHSVADAVSFCRSLRALRPDIVLGADLIAGFPTETEAMFSRSLDLIAICGITHLHAFPFSARPGTPAARMPAVRPEVVRERAARLREAGDAALLRHLDAETGGTRSVLVEGSGLGRTEGFATVRFPAPVGKGEIRTVRIAGHTGRELLAAA